MAQHQFTFVLLTGSVVNGVGSAESAACDLTRADDVPTLQIKATSATGTPRIRVQFATSPDGVSFDAYADNPDLIADTSAQFPNNLQGWNRVLVGGVVGNSFVKFKFTGVGANPADTVVAAKLAVNEQLPGRLAMR